MLRKIGSLKLTVVLLVALAGAMALASMYEARHGTEAALRLFYGSRWFAALLGAVGVNALSALLVRWPLRRSQAGFVVAHAAILIILLGAWITRIWSVNGRLWLRPQETRSDFDGDRWVLAFRSPDGAQTATVPLDVDGPVFDPAQAGQQVDGVTWTVERFAPDTVDEGERIVADPNGRQPAVKIRLGHGQHRHDQWLLGGRPETIGGVQIRCLRLTDRAVLDKLLEPTSSPAVPERGKLVAELDGRRYVIDVGEHLGRAVPLGQTGYRARIRRYLPHARVEGREIRSATSRPVNPMIEFDLIDPTGKTVLHRLFARFPNQDFAAAHATATAPASQPVKFSYVDATVLANQPNRIDLLLDADDHLHARFSDANGNVTSTPLEPNRPAGTPWQQTQLTVLDLLPRARAERALRPVDPPTANGMPAALICLRADAADHRLWVRKGETYDVHIAGRHVQVGFVPTRIPMGFSIKLLEPVITYCPGSNRARTYESRVFVDDPDRQVKLERTISMNAPLDYGGYAFYQSSYHFDQNNRPVATMLSVAADPGEPVVYAGYVGLIVGMVLTVAQQVRRRARSRAKA